MSAQKRLQQMLARHDLSLSAVARRTGISQPYLSLMLAGKRPVSEANWLRLLTKLEGFSAREARAELARWQIEDAQDSLQRTGIVVQGNHNELHFGSASDRDLAERIAAASPRDKALIRQLLDSLADR